ncbi:MAG TPA: copper chaperone PCu(A)C [Stellaceae bacterium]|nr:copper chaperone PCu(A)C [Stellaceae bacterium]
MADSSGIKVDRVWARATPGAAKTAAIYFTVTNSGTTPDTLEGTASTPAAEHAGLHEEKMVSGVMEMRPIESLTIAPGKSLTLEPNGYHLMLTGLKAPLKEGQSVPLTLTFEHAGTRQVTASVAKVGAMHAGEPSGAGNGMPGMSNDMSSMPGMSH